MNEREKRERRKSGFFFINIYSNNIKKTIFTFIDLECDFWFLAWYLYSLGNNKII
jgi:hypothetical protein